MDAETIIVNGEEYQQTYENGKKYGLKKEIKEDSKLKPFSEVLKKVQKNLKNLL